MDAIGLAAIPDTIRVALSPDGENMLWSTVTDRGGVTAVSEQTGISRSKLYNWRHHQTFLPVPFVRDVLGADAADRYVTAMKGGGRSIPFEPGTFPLPVDTELLTRIDCSVHVNRDGVPTYQAIDVGNVNRVITLLQHLGDVPLSLYHREVYELRYPAYLHDILTAVPHDDDVAALVDETGNVRDDIMVAGDRQVPIDQFDGTLHHRGKKMQLALARGDSDTITALMASEAEKVQQLVQ